MDFNNKTASSIYIDNKEVDTIEINGDVVYKRIPDYLYIENTYQGQNTISLTTTQSGTPTSGTYATSVQYSKDKSTWTTLTLTAGGSNSITLNQGEKVYFRNNNGVFNYTDDSKSFYTGFNCSEQFDIGGNMNTLLDYEHLDNITLPQGCFSRMFVNAKVVNASNLKLPSTTLSPHCYRALFNNCTSLTAAPVLPATTLAEKCYYAMFLGDTSLTTAPNINATTLANACCDSMFRDCTGITSVTLTATTLAQYCYTVMFFDCSSLNQVTTYANDISAYRCIRNWLSGVSSTGDFYNLGSASYPSGVDGIPTGWTEYKCKLSNVVLTNTGTTEYSVSANMEWASSLNWEQAEILIFDQGGGQPAWLDFGQSEVINGVLTPSTLMDFIDTPQPQSYCEITLYDEYGSSVFYQNNIPYTIQ